MRGFGDGRKATPRRLALTALALAVLAASPFLIAGTGGFMNIDDGSYVLENGGVRGGLSLAGLRWALTSFDAANWHPLTWASHMLDVSLFGLDPRGHHLTSILLHAVSTALLFTALARMTGALGRSAFAAAIFGIHPLHVESVAWVAERKDVLSGLIFMLLLLAYESYARRGGVTRYLRVAALLALGLTAKPMLVTAPFVLLLLDYWPLGRLQFHKRGERGTGFSGAVFAEKAPLFALAVASGALTVIAQHSGGAIRTMAAIAPGLRVANALVSLVAYLGNTIWPASLAVYYPYPVGGIPWERAAAAGLLLAGISVTFLIWRRYRPYLAVGWCWYLGMLLPVIGIVQVGEQAKADRYTYLPLVGIFISATWLAASLARGRGAKRAGACAVAAVVVTVSGVALSTRQAGFWRDSETLFRRALDVTKDNWLAHNNLAIILMERGQYAAAIGHLEEVVRLAPSFRAEALSNIGNALAALGRAAEAVVRYRTSIQLRPNFAAARYNLGLVLADLGRPAEAETEYREALRLQQDFPAACTDLARLLASVGRIAEAESYYREAIRLDPAYGLAQVNFCEFLTREGRFREAETSCREAIRLRPDAPKAQANLGLALLSQGRSAGAAATRELTRP